MCVVSMIGEHYNDRWKNPEWFPVVNPIITTTGTNTLDLITREEFDRLKADVLEMKDLLKRALKYDEENNEPDCETAEKVELIKKIAEAVGVDLSEIFSNK